MPNELATTVNSTYFPFTRNVVGTAAAATVVVWSPVRPRTVKPPPSQPVDDAAPPRPATMAAAANNTTTTPAEYRQTPTDACLLRMNPPMRLGPFRSRAFMTPPRTGSNRDSLHEHSRGTRAASNFVMSHHEVCGLEPGLQDQVPGISPGRGP